MSEDFEDAVSEAFADRFDADAEEAAAAAAKAAAFRADVDEDLTVEALVGAIEDADDYDAFVHRFDRAIGDLAAADADCTDSRPYRLAGFDDLAADPEIGA
jgi:hypothetical protein